MQNELIKLTKVHRTMAVWLARGLPGSILSLISVVWVYVCILGLGDGDVVEKTLEIQMLLTHLSSARRPQPLDVREADVVGAEGCALW